MRHGVLPVEDRELSIDCLHNPYCANFLLCFDAFHGQAYTESTPLCVLHLQKRNHHKASGASSTPQKSCGVNIISRMTKRAMCPRRCGVRWLLNVRKSG